MPLSKCEFQASYPRMAVMAVSPGHMGGICYVSKQVPPIYPGDTGNLCARVRVILFMTRCVPLWMSWRRAHAARKAWNSVDLLMSRLITSPEVEKGREQWGECRRYCAVKKDKSTRSEKQSFFRQIRCPQACPSRQGKMCDTHPIAPEIPNHLAVWPDPNSF